MISRISNEQLERLLPFYRDMILELEQIIGVQFKNKKLLLAACIHSSFSNEKNLLINNEVLEFLGDAVLSVIISEFLVKKLKGSKEGDLARLKSALASENNLSECAERLSLSKFLLLGKGASKEDRGKKSNLADFAEAIIGAIYYDSGLRKARRFVLTKLLNQVESIDLVRYDPKSALQEYAVRNLSALPRYKIIGSEGPPHKRVYSCNVVINNTVVASGKGKSKKEAEKEAALNALMKLGVI